MSVSWQEGTENINERQQKDENKTNEKTVDSFVNSKQNSI